VFINEIHYANIGIDKYEGVEIAGPAGTNLKGWSVHFYNGPSVYASINLSGILPNQKNGFGALFFAKKDLVDKNGGVALVDSKSSVVLFLSFDGVITASNGPAAGKSSEQLPVHEGFFSLVTNSMQLVGTGSYYEDFKWVVQGNSSGSINRGQTFVAVARASSVHRPHPHRHDKPAEPPKPPAPAEPAPEPAPAPTPEPAPQPHPVENAAKAVVNNVNFLVQENRVAHHTELYATDTLILRRGQTFVFDVEGSNLSNSRFEVLLSAHPEEQLTVIQVKSAAGDKGDFYAYFSDASKITVNIPATVPIGQYTLDLRVDDNVVTHFSEPFIVLFNPWSSDDTVFLDNEVLRKEYVLQENGLIWRGSADNNGPCSWNFAQFQKTVVLATLRLLEAVSIDERANPVVVSRRLTVLENDRVLYGNWSGNYAGGSAPSSWTGSKEIISQFYQTGKPVKFGQCWVFSGVLTTLCRSIGIPCRSVTNFESAHDTNFNRVVDKYYVPDGTLDKEKTNDSVWNFHVWNDAWFSRPDIVEKRFSGPGWQAIDATPQEKSDGEYQTGPCPLSAIKEGVDTQYDWKFIFGEVNADVRHYVKSNTGEYKLVQTETASVGKSISTKAVGAMQREDVTVQYKYAEGSKEERAAFGAEGEKKELLVFGRMEVPEVQIGQAVPVSVFLQATKETGEEKTVKIVVKATVVSYTGKERGVIINSDHDIKVPGDGSEIELTLKIASDHYLPYASEHFSINLQLFIFSDTDAEVDSLIIKRFSLKDVFPTIEAPEKVGANEAGNITIKYTNPLETPLTNVTFSIEGSGLVSHTKSQPKTVAPGETTSQSFSLKGPKKVGERVIKVLVSSKELETVYTYKSVTVV